MRLIFAALLTFLSLSANELDSLLDSYVEESDLSNETKVEDTGTTQLTVFTRKDLDRMKFQSLKDIFTTQRIFSYKEGRLGYVDFFSAEPYGIGKAGQTVKIFIDDYEVTTSYYGGGLTIFGNIELDFVDHIEIYEGPASYEHSTEASVLTIKLYSKTGYRDNGGKIGAVVDHRGGHKEYTYIAGLQDEIEYYAYASNRDIQRKDIENISTDLSRDETQKHLYSTLKYKNNKLTLQYFTQNKDAFLTNSFDATPTKDDIKQDYFHIGYDAKFLDDDSLKVKLGFSRHRFSEEFQDDNPIAILYGMPLYGEKRDIVENLLSFDIQKKYKTQNNDLLIGALLRSSKLNYKANQYLATTALIPVDLPHMIEKQKYYSLYFQDAYKLNEHNTIFLGLKLDYENTSNFDSEYMLNRRISHTYKNSNFTFMNYYTYQPMLKNAYMFNNTENGIENEVIEILGNETRYRWNDFEFRYVLYKIYLKNIVINAKNLDEKMDMLGSSFRVAYDIDEDNSIMGEVWRFDLKLNTIDVDNKIYGFNLRSLNKYKKFNLTNELVILDSTGDDTEDGIGWQYNLGISYQYSKDLELFVKGYNIFNTAIEYNYLNYKNAQESITSTEQRFYAGFGYTF